MLDCSNLYLMLEANQLGTIDSSDTPLYLHQTCTSQALASILLLEGNQTPVTNCADVHQMSDQAQVYMSST